MLLQLQETHRHHLWDCHLNHQLGHPQQTHTLRIKYSLHQLLSPDNKGRKATHASIIMASKVANMVKAATSSTNRCTKAWEYHTTKWQALLRHTMKITKSTRKNINNCLVLSKLILLCLGTTPHRRKRNIRAFRRLTRGTVIQTCTSKQNRK